MLAFNIIDNLNYISYDKGTNPNRHRSVCRMQISTDYTTRRLSPQRPRRGLILGFTPEP